MNKDSERPCLNCGKKPLQHTARYMECFIDGKWSYLQYAADPDKEGRMPVTKPEYCVTS